MTKLKTKLLNLLHFAAGKLLTKRTLRSKTRQVNKVAPSKENRKTAQNRLLATGKLPTSQSHLRLTFYKSIHIAVGLMLGWIVLEIHICSWILVHFRCLDAFKPQVSHEAVAWLVVRVADAAGSQESIELVFQAANQSFFFEK